jgi:hypothetical protein
MVFPKAQALTPYITSSINPETREIWKEPYPLAKKYGIRASFGAVIGSGMVSMVKEVAKDGIQRHVKRLIGVILVDNSLTFVFVGIPLLTNATKVVKTAKAVHSACCHNVAEIPTFALEFVLFGEGVQSFGEADYDWYSQDTDIIGNIIE